MSFVPVRGLCAQAVLRCRGTQGRSASSLASLVCQAEKSSTAVAAPKQGVCWTFGEIEEKAGRVAAGLAKHGVTRGSTVVTDLPNSVENLLLQVSCSWLGAAVATAKDESQLAELQKVTDLRLAVTHTAGDSVNAVLARYPLPASPVIIEDLNGELIPLATTGASIPTLEAPKGEAALGFWSSTKALTNREAIDEMGAAAKERLTMTATDRVLVSITLCHAFGIGSAVSSAWLAGAGLVLPGASGIRGCGSPSQRAEATLAAMISEKCSLLFADVHTLKALPPTTSSELVLRGGCCKVGSGADFLEVKEAKLGPNGEMMPLEYAKVPLVAVGKR